MAPVDRGEATTPLQELSGYGTGTVLHVDALSQGADTALAGLDVAFSGAAFALGAADGPFRNEMGRALTDALKAAGAYGRGDGLELGIASPPDAIIGELAQAVAPPSTDLVHKVVGPISVPGVVDVELLRGRAQARSADEGCVLGSNLSYGLGSVARVSLLDKLIATTAAPPDREVSSSTSRTAIVPGKSGRLALLGETRQTIAPVTFFGGTANQFTVEILGEWVLRVLADGSESTVHYGPAAKSPTTPVLRIIDAKNKEMFVLNTQQLLGDEGLVLEIPGVALVVVGEDPRAINGDAASKPVLEPTRAEAAADVVRVQLLDGDLADVRLGHMETAVAVPASGVSCPGINVEQAPVPAQVEPGDEFSYVIDIANPNEGTLTDLKVVENITAPPGLKFEITDKGGSQTTLTDIGPLGPGEKKELVVKVTVDPTSPGGTMGADAAATGVYQSPAEGPDAGTGPVPVEGQAPAAGPEVVPPTCALHSVIGLPLEEAKAKLIEAGCTLVAVTVPTEDPTDVGRVMSQDPAPGGLLPPGAAVNVKVAGPIGGGPSRDQLAVQGATESRPSVVRTLPRTGGIALAGVALAMLGAGVALRAGGRRRRG